MQCVNKSFVLCIKYQEGKNSVSEHSEQLFWQHGAQLRQQLFFPKDSARHSNDNGRSRARVNSKLFRLSLEVPYANEDLSVVLGD